MPIEVNLDLMMVKRKMSLTELSEKVGITMAKGRQKKMRVRSVFS